MSVHLIHMHVAAQNFVMGAVTLVMGCSMCKEFWTKPKPWKKRSGLGFVVGACFLVRYLIYIVYMFMLKINHLHGSDNSMVI
ncbi:unnamed protein product [Gulo gulo]|uniref:Uncharacterized protein n=1 Tax=Gulo gulo TaxID=48420 RepID=A0A9X9LEA8_GULGU|nr:unnamed protein product [Gulo gulo]